ncbi:50S ribosomal protein L18, chloroplastic [Linum perenne]
MVSPNEKEQKGPTSILWIGLDKGLSSFSTFPLHSYTSKKIVDSSEKIITVSKVMATCSFSTNFLGFSHNQLSALVAGNPRSSSIALPSRLTVEAKARTRGDDRVARHIRIRKKVEGTTERPRLSVYRSNKHFYVQVIDDSKMHTLAAASTMQKAMAEELNFTGYQEVAQKVGEAIAKACLEKGITKVAFDRGGYPYHGRVKALADAARENGLQF